MRTILLFMLATAAFGQATFPSTTTNSPMTAYSTDIPLTSTAKVFSPGTPVSGGIGEPPVSSTNWIILIEQEAICVDVVAGSTVIGRRGCEGTYTQSHVAGSLAWTGPAYYYHPSNPSNPCQVVTPFGIGPPVVALPWITLPSGNVFDCTGGVWVLRAPTAHRYYYLSRWGRFKQWLLKKWYR